MSGALHASEQACVVGLIGPIGWLEATIILVVGLLLFGRRLPEVGRSLGRSIVEFRKGIKGIEDEVERESTAARPTPRIESDARTVGRSSAEFAEPAQTAAPVRTESSGAP